MNVSSVDRSGSHLLEPTSNLLANVMPKVGGSEHALSAREIVKTSFHDKQLPPEGDYFRKYGIRCLPGYVARG